jgi:hypothetical protein
MSKDDKTTYTKLTIDCRIGLNSIVTAKCNAVDVIRWTMDNSIRDAVKKALYKSILLEYVSLYDSKTITKLNKIVDTMSF